MDPLSISASIVSLGAACMQTAKALNSLKERFRVAGLTIQSICAESMLIGLTLSKLQGLLIERPEVLTDRLQPESPVETIFENLLTGCMVVYSVLEDEIRRITDSEKPPNSITFMVKARYVWNEDVMQSLLRDIRGQQIALTTLIQLLQLDSIFDLHRQIEQKQELFKDAAKSTRRLRSSRTSTRCLNSIYDAEFDTQKRMLCEDVSMISSTAFDFDDMIVNSTVYRRALKASKSSIEVQMIEIGRDTKDDQSQKSTESKSTVRREEPSQHVTSTSVPGTYSDRGSQTSERSISNLFESKEIENDFSHFDSTGGEISLRAGRVLETSKWKTFIASQDRQQHQALHWLNEELSFCLGKYSKVKRYYFEREADVMRLLKAYNSIKSVYRYKWMDLTYIKRDGISSVLAARVLIRGFLTPLGNTVSIETYDTDTAEAIKAQISRRTSLDLAFCDIYVGSHFIPGDMVIENSAFEILASRLPLTLDWQEFDNLHLPRSAANLKKELQHPYMRTVNLETIS